MIARPKMSQIEWKTIEIRGSSEVGNFSPFFPPGQGLRHGAGTLFFDNGDEWRGTFHLDEARGRGTYKWAATQTENSDDERSTGTLEIRTRDALYHRNARAAWVDELVPGRRVRIPTFALSNVGEAGTIVGQPGAGTCRRSDCKYEVHFDKSGQVRDSFAERGQSKLPRRRSESST